MSIIKEPVKTLSSMIAAVMRFAALGIPRRGGRRRIVAPDGNRIVPTSKPQPGGTRLKALARASRWQRMLDEGVYATVSDIGDAENISKSDVSRTERISPPSQRAGCEH
jgi:hypothetical protein